MLNFIDISNHQAGLRVRDVPTAALIVKATEGRGWRDNAMPGFIAQARSADKPAGFYAFVSQGNTPTAEADNLLSYTERHRRDNDVLVLDWEPSGSRPGPRDVDWARRWLEHVDARVPNPLWSYMNLSTANGADWRPVTSRWPLLWLAHYPGSNTANGYVPAGARGALKGSNEWQLSAWQFTDGGRLPGWAGRLDLNELYRPWWEISSPPPAPAAEQWDGSPVRGVGVSTPFGQRGRHWSTDRNAQGEGIHTGDDYAAAEGTPVYAVVDGTVTVRDDQFLGCMSILAGDNGRFYWYCHLQRGSRDPWRGERVKAGQMIARVGSTGNATGPHLHLEDCGSPIIWRQGLRKPSWPRPVITITEEADVPDLIRYETEFDHDGIKNANDPETGWQLPAEAEGVIVAPRSKALFIDAKALIRVPEDVTLRTRWVSWSGREDPGWVRSPSRRHESNEAETVWTAKQAWAGADLRLDVWCDKPCRVRLLATASVLEMA